MGVWGWECGGGSVGEGVCVCSVGEGVWGREFEGGNVWNGMWGECVEGSVGEIL